jgi:hypothetical protein
MSDKKSKFGSVAERRAKFNAILKRHKEGADIHNACFDEGVSYGTYSNWRKEFLPKPTKATKKKAAPQTRLTVLEAAPAVSPMGKIIALIGSPEEIMGLVRGFA